MDIVPNAWHFSVNLKAASPLHWLINQINNQRKAHLEWLSLQSLKRTAIQSHLRLAGGYQGNYLSVLFCARVLLLGGFTPNLPLDSDYSNEAPLLSRKTELQHQTPALAERHRYAAAPLSPPIVGWGGLQDYNISVQLLISHSPTSLKVLQRCIITSLCHNYQYSILTPTYTITLQYW